MYPAPFGVPPLHWQSQVQHILVFFFKCSPVALSFGITCFPFFRFVRCREQNYSKTTSECEVTVITMGMTQLQSVLNVAAELMVG